MVTCKECVYFKNKNNFGVGMCCRFPPIPVGIVTGDSHAVKTDIVTRYPEVQENYWCGEHVAK